MQWLKLEPNVLFGLLNLFATRWLQMCGIETLGKFETWLKERNVKVIKFHGGIAFILDYFPGHKLTLHPLFFPGELRNAPQTELKKLFEFADVSRIEVKVLETAGHTIRRWLRESGFEKEGVLRNYSVDHLSPEKPLISTEIWAILR